MHVLEHVGNPHKTLSAIVAHCRPGGLIYIEVPSEYPGDEAVQAGNLPRTHQQILHQLRTGLVVTE